VLRGRVKALLVVAVLLIAVATYYSLQFRKIGLSNYLAGGREGSERDGTLFVDYNLYVIARLTQIFPKDHDYLGFAVPLWIIARPIPRVIWPEKGDDDELSAQTYLGMSGLTVASTFIGECFMGAGYVGVAIAAILLGALATWWTTRTLAMHSDFGMLIYASGF